MKHIEYIIACVFCLFLISACHDLDEKELNSDCEIKSIYIKFAGADRQYPGVIAENTISIDVPIYQAGTELLIETDISQMEIIASIPVGAVIEPGLVGLKDLNQPMVIKVKAANGNTKNYQLTVYKTGMNYTVGLLEFAIIKEGQTVEYQSNQVPPYQNGEVIYIDIPDTPKDPLDITKLRARVKLQPTCTLTPEIGNDFIDFTEPLEIKVTDGMGTERTHYIAVRPTEFSKTKFTHVWFRNTDDLGLTRTNIQGLALTKDNFFIEEFEDWSLGKIFVFDSENGLFVKHIEQPTSFSSQIAADDNNHLSATTKNDFGKGYEFYRYDDINSSSNKLFTFVSWDPAIVDQFGINKTSITGNTKDGKAYVYTTMPNGNYYSWEMNNGTPTSAAPVITQFDPAKTGGTWDIASVKRASAAANSDMYFCWYNEGATENDGKGSRFEIHDSSNVSYQLNPKNHFYKILAFDVFTVNNDKFVAMLTQGLKGDSEARLMVFEITDKAKLPLDSSQPGYVNLKVYESSPLGITTDLSSGDVQVNVDGMNAYIYVATTATSSQAKANAGVRKYKMEYIVE